MFGMKTIADAGNKSIADATAANEAELKMNELRAAAVAAIRNYNGSVGTFLGLRDAALKSIVGASDAASVVAEAHKNDVLPQPIPDPDQAASAEGKLSVGSDI